MLIESDLSRLALGARELVRLRDAGGLTIACDSGSVWVTRDGDIRDVILSAGERTELEPGAAQVLIQAFEASRLAIGPACATAPTARRAESARGSAPRRATVGDCIAMPA